MNEEGTRRSRSSIKKDIEGYEKASE